MAKESIELSFLVDVAEFVLNLPKTVSLKAGNTVNYPVENGVDYTVAPSAGLTGKVTAEVITDANENKFLQIKALDEATEELVGTITVTPNGQDAVEIGVKVEATTVEPEPEPKPEEPVITPPDINDDTEVPTDGSLFLQFIGITANQKIEVKERRNKIVYFRTNGDKYTVASAVEGNVSVQTVEEQAKEKDGNAYKVVKLKITGVAKSSDVKITVSAERGEDDPVQKPETTITVNETISVEKDKTAKLYVTTNAADYSYEITAGDDKVNVEKTDGGINITGVAEGEATIAIKAAVDGGEEKVVNVTVTVTAATTPQA